ncbi:MAG: MotA/TolQ/ExbB proton channel family protein [Proteobacteria bacterium]|nr:MotA/TolQ/ExbB proton channel family protein [Pseudomonadota bacterium]
MDLGTLVGIVLGFGLILGSMALGGGIMPFVNVQSVLIVVGGTLSATLINQRVPYVLGAIKVMLQAFFDRSRPADEMIPTIVHLAGKARKEGLVSLEGEQIDDDFMARGVRLGVDGLSPDIIKTTLTSELFALKQRHQRGQKIFRFMGGTAPSMGLIGTIIGLVQMLRNLEDPDSIGPAMAVALLTTLYGAILAFLVFNPIADKLENRTVEEVHRKRLAIVGVESILKGDNSMVIQSKLDAFLSPEERARQEAAK